MESGQKYSETMEFKTAVSNTRWKQKKYWLIGMNNDVLNNYFLRLDFTVAIRKEDLFTMVADNSVDNIVKNIQASLEDNCTN